MAVAITETATSARSSLQPLWHAETPPNLLASCPTDDLEAGWKHWQEHLWSRNARSAPPFLKGKRPGLLWGWPAEWDRAMIRHAAQSPDVLADIVAHDDCVATPDLFLSLEMLGLAYALPALAKKLHAKEWWFLIEKLHDTAVQAAQQGGGWPSDPRDVLRQQLLAGEMALALSYLFPEVRALRLLADQARGALSEALAEVTDGEGLLHAHLLPVLAPLFACWTRVRWLGNGMEVGPWSEEAETQYQWLVRRAIRLANADGTFLFDGRLADESGSKKSAPWTKPLFKMALELAGDRGDFAAATEALPGGAIPEHGKIKQKDLPSPILHSDWSGVAVLADGWKKSNIRLAVAYADEPISIDLSVGGTRLFAGEWITKTLCDGRPVEAISDWEFLCWEKSKRFNLLEMGMKLTEGLRLERQIVFGVRDHVVYFADMIVSSDDSPRRLQHSISLPLAADAHWAPEVDTRDGVITIGKQQAAVLPLGLAEWRNDPRGGSLEESGQRLILTQEAHGRAMCCPLFVDLCGKRSKRERTWRQLTVGDNMEIVPRDAAVAFRAQSGGGQWLFYRSLGRCGNRTFLGHNIAGEFTAGRFHDSGEYEEWIEIESV